jgi:hypothetical protein
MVCPGCIGDKSTSIDESASTSAAGFMLSMNGHATAQAPTPPKAVAVKTMKSRRVVSVEGECGLLMKLSQR